MVKKAIGKPSPRPILPADVFSRPTTSETILPDASTERMLPEKKRVVSKKRTLTGTPRLLSFNEGKKSPIGSSQLKQRPSLLVARSRNSQVKRAPCLPEDIETQTKLEPRMLLPDDGVAFPKLLLDHFKKYRGCCALIKDLNKEPSRVAKYLYNNKRIDLERLRTFDASGTLSHFLLFSLASFERDCLLHEKKLPMIPPLKPIFPTTDAESIAAFSLEQTKQLSKAQRGKKRARGQSKEAPRLVDDRKAQLPFETGGKSLPKMGGRSHRSMEIDIPVETQTPRLTGNRGVGKGAERQAFGPRPTSTPNAEMSRLISPNFQYANEEELKRMNAFGSYVTRDP